MSKPSRGAHAPKRDLSKLVDTTPLPTEASTKSVLATEASQAADAEPPAKGETPEARPSESIQKEQKLMARTIRFSEDDEAEIDRIDEYLRERGLKRTDATKIIRLALKVAFRDVSDEDLRAYHQEIQIKHARGKKPVL